MRTMEENLEQEKQRQISHLESEIKRRREKKEKKRRKQLEEEEARAAKADDEEERRQMQEMQQRQVEQLQQQLKHGARPSTPIYKKLQVTTDVSKAYELTASRASKLQIRDVDLNQLLMSTPLFNQISDIHKILQSKSNENHFERVRQSQTSGDSSYIDLKDAQWECKGELVPLDIQDLKPSDFVVYRFGIFVASLLSKQSQLSGVSLLIASNLPSNNYRCNCFRNSFFYQHSKKILFIRKERLESIGEFVVVIVHCLSHIKVGDLANDGNPLFLREFYQVSQAYEHQGIDYDLLLCLL